MLSCSDFYETDPDTIINSEDYIKTDNEIYRGFFGIMNKLQKAGDHAILLTDTRGDFLEVTKNAPLELQQIYRYEPTNGNSYADPSCYYAIVIAVNDFVSKVSEYCKSMNGMIEDNTLSDIKSLVSSSVRIKVWAYIQLAKIYGEAVWFDDPLVKKIDLTNSEIFTYCGTYKEIIEKCMNLMDNGVTINGEQVPSTLVMDWSSYMNEEKSGQITDYDHWHYMVPRALLLDLELHQWRGNSEDYLWVKNTILDYLHGLYSGKIDPEILNFEAVDCMYYYQCNLPLTGNYQRLFFNQLYNGSNNTYFKGVINGIEYDYDNKQTNRIMEYFCPQSPGKYYLKPTSYAISKYGDSDYRGFIQRICMNVINGDTCLTKYYYKKGTYLSSELVEINPVIPMYRGHDFHFMLAEAENHLGNWKAARDILNYGLMNDPEWVKKEVPKGWDSRYFYWAFGKSATDGYANNGITGCVVGKPFELPEPTDPNYSLTEAERIKIYDLAIADGALLEYTGEGKSYGYLVRMAERYNDPNIVADRVCPKYPAALQSSVRSAIQAGGYWVDWDLKIQK